MGRALFIPYFAGLAQPPLAFRPWLCGKGAPQYPGWAGRCSSHILLGWRSRRRLFQPWLCGKGIPQYPGDGPGAVHPYFAGLAQPPRLFRPWLCGKGTPQYRGWAGRCSSHILLGWRSRRWLFRPWLCGKGTPQYPGDGPGAVHPYFCWVGAAAAGFPAMALRQGRTTVPRGMGRALFIPYFAGLAQPPLAFAVWMRPGSSLAGAAPNYWQTKRPPLREPFQPNALA